MIYQEMYGYLSLEDPLEQQKAWKSLSPQARDYIKEFIDQMKQAGEHFYYDKSKFYGLITANEFENLRYIYLNSEINDVVIDQAFEEEFEKAFISYSKKAEMKAKMNQWRAEMEDEVPTSPVPMLEQESVFYNKRRMMETNDSAYHATTSHSKATSSLSKAGCIIIIIMAILILVALYWAWK